MFIDEYRLETNPFAADRVRPFFASDGVRYASRRIADLLGGQLDHLYLYGDVGVGKTTLVRRQLADADGLEVCWIDSGIDGAEALLVKLIKDIGPGTVDGSISELRKILSVYLNFQSSRGSDFVIVVDELDELRGEVLREIEGIFRLQARNRPIVRFLFVSRSEELVRRTAEEHEGAHSRRSALQRLHGFTLEETGAHIRTTLKSAGCHWADELISDEIVLDIQALTQGVVGDVDAVCRDALDELSGRAGRPNQRLKLTQTLIRNVGAEMHLRYDAAPWEAVESEAPAPESIQLHDLDGLTIESARLLVSSGGARIGEVPMNRARLVLGRDQTCDISLNSSFISRYQSLFMETSKGWVLIDLNSTNGCFVNGRRVSEHRLADGDLISIGHHQIRFVVATRSAANGASRSSRADLDATLLRQVTPVELPLEEPVEELVDH